MRNVLTELPGKNCGLCGMKTCADFAEIVEKNPASIERCPHVSALACAACAPQMKPNLAESGAPEVTWKDHLNRDYDFVLDKFPGEAGPRETILLFNPANVEKLRLKKGDVIYGRPGWISCGCPAGSSCGVGCTGRSGGDCGSMTSGLGLGRGSGRLLVPLVMIVSLDSNNL